MQQHQHGPQCRHGPGGHGHGGHGHSHGPQGLGFNSQLQETSPQEYFKLLRKKWGESRQFFWQEVLGGLAADKLYEKWGLQFLRSLNCQMLLMVVGSLQMGLSCEWMPARLRPLVTGLLCPLLFLFFFNYHVVAGVAGHFPLLQLLMSATVGAYVLVALRGNSALNQEKWQKKSQEIYRIRPYLENPQMSCGGCNIVKPFRAMHCPACKSCIAKHSRHSVAFGICIGAANELAAILFFLLLFVTQVVTLGGFAKVSTYGFLTRFMFYLLNGWVCWTTLRQTATLFILNIVHGVTEQELKTWRMQQYLLKVPQREFQNNVDQGCLTNLTNSFYALIGLGGSESKTQPMANPLAFSPVDPSQKHLINWDRAFYYLVPQLPCHRNRAQIQEMLEREQPRMIEMFRLQAKFREEVVAESAGETLNEFQLQQRTALKMQTHMMRMMPQAVPSPDQQRNIQLQMLAHMQKEFASEPDLAQQISALQAQLTENQLTPIETNMKMRQLQQELMGRRMGKMKQQAESLAQAKPKREEEEEAPMKVADEDL